MNRPYDASYYTRFPLCAGCNKMFTAKALLDGKCHECREALKTPAWLWWLIAFAMLAFLSGYVREAFAWQACYSHGDWLDTPYCDAAARGMEGV